MKFTKMQGIGNDYVYVDCTKENKIENPAELSKKVSNRHFGIGSDGLILIENSNVADFKMAIYNADGSQAEMCGNGIRCVAKFVFDKGLINKENITIETLAGIKQLKLSTENGKVKKARVDMGEPILEAKKIPVISDKNPVIDLQLQAADKTFTATCVSMGNPHAITFVNNVEEFDVEKYGKILEIKKEFPKHSNIEFVELIDKNNIKMRVWERGSGETLACGTGSCASVVACILNNKTERKVNVHLLGGTLEIEWNKQNNHVYMEGPAEIVFEGEI